MDVPTMMGTDWKTEKLTVYGTFHECRALTSFFEWRGPPVIGVEGLTIVDGRVVSESLGKPRFGSPRKMVRLEQKYHDRKDRYTTHEDAVLELYRIRTTDSTQAAHFIPSERPLHGVDAYEGVLTAQQTADGHRIWHQRTRFGMSLANHDETVRVCTPLDGNAVTDVSENRASETGLGDEFEPLMPVKPASRTLKGAAVR